MTVPVEVERVSIKRTLTCINNHVKNYRQIEAEVVILQDQTPVLLETVNLLQVLSVSMEVVL